MREGRKKNRVKKIKLKERRGITLIALIITIIILLILAGISIAALTGDSGIIERAKNAKKESEISSLKEQISLAIIQAELKHRDATLDNVIEELVNEGIILDESSVNKITGEITTKKPQYVIEGMLDDYLDTENIDETDIFLETVKDKNNITQEELEEFNKNLEDGKKIILIKTFEDLDKIGKEQNYPLNGLYIQAEDIKFTETNILKPIENFTGIYNGNSKTIYNLQLNIYKDHVGIFAENKGKLKNMIVSNYNIVTEYSSVGTIVGNNEGLITNCIVKEGNVATPESSGKGGLCIGGICGMNQNGGTIKQCTNYSTVSGNQKLVGGICGYSLGGNIESCYNYGNIEGNYQVGGIAGDSQGNDENSIIYLKNCKNFGNIKGIKNEESTYIHSSIAGIVGCNFKYSILQDNENQGKIESNAQAQGGISGSNYYIIRGCNNTGELINTKEEGNTLVGGITGYNLGKIENCFNKGNISGSMEGGLFIGGVVGCSTKTTSSGVNDVGTENCYNTGNVSGNKYVGGIAGRVSTGASINSCYNIGEVLGDICVGGIAGDTISDTSKEIKNSYNKGNVTANTSYVGGIVGIIRCNVENVYNSGKITINSTSDRFGGTFGAVDTAFMDVSNIKNVYYLDTTCDKGYGNESVIGNIKGVNKKTSEEMINLFSLLGSEFKQNTEGDRYPKLKWE